MNLTVRPKQKRKFSAGTSLLFLAMGCAGQATHPKKQRDTASYYSKADFAAVRKVDAHVHIRTSDTSFAHQARLDNFQLLSIVVDEPPGMEKQEAFAIGQRKQYPNRISFASTFSVDEWNSPDWTTRTIRLLKKSFENGAIAVKIYKNIGMVLRDSLGRFVMIDNPRFDSVLDFLSANKIPVIGHLGEPRDCWLPLSEMKMKSNQRYYSRNPGFYMFLHPDYPSYNQQIAARDHMLQKHPDLRFIGAHLGSLEWNTDTLAMHLDKLPNMVVDMAARISDLEFLAAKDWQKVHDFFIRYQNRIIYGTDRIAEDADPPSGKTASIHEAWLRDWNFLATGESLHEASFNAGFKGLSLPRKVIDKIYRENIEQVFRNTDIPF